MTEPRSELDAASWAFALQLYGRPGVAEACLALQAEAGVDVMMMLMVVFAAARYRVLLAPAEIAGIDAACRPWREQIVQPLRAVRSRLKTGPLPAPGPDTEPFRSTIKAAELAAERLQNRLLADLLPLRAPDCAVVAPEQLRRVIESVVTLALRNRGGARTPDLAASIEVIASAAATA